jgi:hypothetical protein
LIHFTFFNRASAAWASCVSRAAESPAASASSSCRAAGVPAHSSAVIPRARRTCSADRIGSTATTSFDPIVVVAGLVPFVGMILVLLLVRNTRATEAGLVRRI